MESAKSPRDDIQFNGEILVGDLRRVFNPWKRLVSSNTTMSQSHCTQTVLLPDLPSYWPFVARENPLATAELVSICDRWVQETASFDARPLSSFMRCKFALFASLAYPNFRDVAHVRVGIEQMHLYYVIDQLTDGNDGPTVRKQCDEVLNALRYDHAAIPVRRALLNVNQTPVQRVLGRVLPRKDDSRVSLLIPILRPFS